MKKTMTRFHFNQVEILIFLISINSIISTVKANEIIINTISNKTSFNSSVNHVTPGNCLYSCSPGDYCCCPDYESPCFCSSYKLNFDQCSERVPIIYPGDCDPQCSENEYCCATYKLTEFSCYKQRSLFLYCSDKVLPKFPSLFKQIEPFFIIIVIGISVFTCLKCIVYCTARREVRRPNRQSTPETPIMPAAIVNPNYETNNFSERQLSNDLPTYEEAIKSKY